MRILDGVADVPASAGTAIRACILQAVSAQPPPPPAVAKQLVLTLDPSVFIPTAAVTTKAVVATVLTLLRASRADLARCMDELDAQAVAVARERSGGDASDAQMTLREGTQMAFAQTPPYGDLGGGPATSPGGHRDGGTPSPNSSPGMSGRVGRGSDNDARAFAPLTAASAGAIHAAALAAGRAALASPPHGRSVGAAVAMPLLVSTPGQRSCPPHAATGGPLQTWSPLSVLGPGTSGDPMSGAATGSAGGWPSPTPLSSNGWHHPSLKRPLLRDCGVHSPRPHSRTMSDGAAAAGAPSGDAGGDAGGACAPPFWPAGTPPAERAGSPAVQCPSQAGGWPGGSREDAAAFMAALTGFCAEHAAKAAAAGGSQDSDGVGLPTQGSELSPDPGAATGATSSDSESVRWRSNMPPPSLPLRLPSFGGKLLDLAGLYREVCMRGGGAAVTAAGLWPAVAAALRVQSTNRETCSVLAGNYATLLAAFEDTFFDASSAGDGLSLHRQHQWQASGGGSGSLKGLPSGDGDVMQMKPSHPRGVIGGTVEDGFSPRGGSDSACATSAGLGRRGSAGGAGCRFTEAEDAIILRARQAHGNKWSAMEALLPGRSPASIKKHWHSTLKFKEAALAGHSGGGPRSGGGLPSHGSQASFGSVGSLNTLVTGDPCGPAHALSAQLDATALGGEYVRPGMQHTMVHGTLSSRLGNHHQMQQQQQQQQQQQVHYNHHGVGLDCGVLGQSPTGWRDAGSGFRQCTASDVGHPSGGAQQLVMPVPSRPGSSSQASLQGWHVPPQSGVDASAAAAAHLSAVAATFGQLPRGMSFTVGPGNTFYWNAPGPGGDSHLYNTH